MKRVRGLLLMVLSAWTGASFASIARTGECPVAGRGHGILSSSFYPSDPPSNQICQWTLTAYSSKVIGLYFEDLDISRGSVLEIYNGSTATNASFLTSYTGKSAAKIDLTLSSVATLVFKSSALSLGYRGFLLMYYSTTSSQRIDGESTYGGALRLVIFRPVQSPALFYVSLSLSLSVSPWTTVGNETIVGGGSLSSPGYSGWYPNNARYTWTLRSCEAGAPLRLVFDEFSLELTYDRVLVYDGDAPNPRNLRSSFTGSTLPPDLILSSVATVVFISDSVGSNRGFAARFSTVIGSSVIGADHMSMTYACLASCPISVRLHDTYCYAHDDPHMRTFDGHYYEHQKEGIFYLYKHDIAPIWVQAAFQSCGALATCSCAVGVRYWNELFVVDRCKLAGSDYRPNRVYKLGSGSMMKIKQQGVGFQVLLPNGLRVVIGGSWAWIGTVDLYPAYGDQNKVQGLCGRYNGNPSDDGTYRCGFNITSGGDPWETWRVSDGETVFTATMPRYAFNMSSCNCSHVPQFPLPHGVLNATGLPTSEISNSKRFDISYDRNEKQQAWPVGWSQDTATQYCNTYIENNPAIRRCQKVIKDLNLDELLKDCVRDIYLTGGTTFALTALEASKEKCINTLAQRNITDQSWRPCPNDCWRRGQCVNGTCHCQAGYYGVDCSTNPGIAPRLRNSTAHPGCSPSGQIVKFCDQERVFGETFYDVVSTNPKCKINVTTYYLLADGTTGRLITSTWVTVAAIYESPSAIICQLPAPGNSTAVKLAYSVSVTNDGLNYSNAISTDRIFIPPCGGSFTGSAIVTSPNYPLDYRNNAQCSWNLTASTNHIVELVMINFVLKDDLDALQVYDQDCLVDRWLGTQPKQIITYGPSLVVTFTSGASGFSKGFDIRFNSIATNFSCGGSMVNNGTLLSPNYPLSYARRTYCVWKLFAEVGKTGVSLQFNDFHTEHSYDSLNVYNGTGSRCLLTEKLSGADLPPVMRLGPSATLVFRADDNTEMSGFRITFTSY